jgi:hypothetical protein
MISKNLNVFPAQLEAICKVFQSFVEDFIHDWSATNVKFADLTCKRGQLTLYVVLVPSRLLFC